MKEHNWIMGLWKFRDCISLEQLSELAQRWAEDARYLQLYIRRASKDQRAIGFTYEIQPGEDVESVQRSYFERTSEALRRSFGNDLTGWDLAATVVVIK